MIGQSLQRIDAAGKVTGQTLYPGDKIGIRLNNKFFDLGIPFVFDEEEGNIPCHLCMADEHILFGSADIDDMDPSGVGPPHLVRFFCRHIQPDTRLLSFRHLMPWFCG